MEAMRNVADESPRGHSEESAEFTVRVASGRSELTAAYGLVYRQYVTKGFIAPRPGGIVYSQTFGLPTSRTVVAILEDGHVIGTWSMVGDNELGLHLEGTFASEVEQLRQKGSRLAEVTCLCTEPEIHISSRAVLFELTKFAVHHSFLRGYDDVLLAVHPHHYPFYWRTLRATQISPCRPYAAVSGSPAVCCRINMAALEQSMAPRMRRYYFGEVKPREHYDGPPVSQADHEEFCRLLAISKDMPDNGQRHLKRWVA